MFAIGTKDKRLLQINNMDYYYITPRNKKGIAIENRHYSIDYNVENNDITFYNDLDDCKKVLKEIKDKSSTIIFNNQSIFKDEEPTVEELTIYELNPEVRPTNNQEWYCKALQMIKDALEILSWCR